MSPYHKRLHTESQEGKSGEENGVADFPRVDLVWVCQNKLTAERKPVIQLQLKTDPRPTKPCEVRSVHNASSRRRATSS